MPLYLIPTPIGNYEDITLRAVETLKNVDLILCEDTRITGLLLSHLGIKNHLKCYQEFNEIEVSQYAIKLLKENKNIALVSDAGTPLLSDPGYVIVKEAIKENIEIISLPGPSAFLTALVKSGVSLNHFYFHGFLSAKAEQREKELKSLTSIKTTLVFYEAPHRLLKMLEDLLLVFGDQEIVVARELTKKHETFYRGLISSLLDTIALKGEFVVIVPYREKEIKGSIKELYDEALKETKNEKLAMKKVASLKNISKSEVYKEIEKHK